MSLLNKNFKSSLELQRFKTLHLTEELFSLLKVKRFEYLSNLIPSERLIYGH